MTLLRGELLVYRQGLRATIVLSYKVAMAKRHRQPSQRESRPSRRPRGSVRPAQTATALDATAVMLGEVAARAYNFDGRVRYPADKVRRGLLEWIGDGLNGREAAEALEAYLGELEAEIASRVRRHGLFWWMFVTRRLQPDPFDNASDWTVSLYRRVLTLAIVKYATPIARGIEFGQQKRPDGTTTLLPLAFSEPEALDAFRLEYLAHEYTAAVGAYRRVGKGAVLRVNGDDFGTPASEDVQALMYELDERVRRFGSLTGAYGAAIDHELDDADQERPLFLLAAQLNVSRSGPEVLKTLYNVDFPGPSNFVPGLLGYDEFRRVLVLFEDEIVAAVGEPPDSILAALWGLSMHLIRSLREHAGVAAQVFRTGYLLVRVGAQYDDLVEGVSGYLRYWWREVRGEPLGEDAALGRARAGLAALTYTEATCAQISLWDRIPGRVIVPADEYWLMIDYAAVGLTVSDLFRTIGFLDGASADIKAKNFEAEVVARASQAGLTVWEHDRELIALDGRRRQIDASVIVGDQLYVVEAKAFSQNMRIDRGDFAALKGRWETMERYLAQAKTLAEFIAENRQGRNYAVPDDVATIEYCLCIPAVDWIPSRRSTYWLTPDVPRVCALEELIEFLRESSDS